MALAGAGVVLALLYMFLVWRPAQPGFLGERPAFRPVALDPAATYRVTLWDFAYPAPGASYAGEAAAWVKSFQERHPNIRVELRLLPPGDPDGEVARALESGRAPDVLAAPFDWAPLASRWVVPLKPYLEQPGGPSRPGRVPAPAGASARILEHWGGFPRWLGLWWWVAGDDAESGGRTGAGGAPTYDPSGRRMSIDATGQRAALEVLAESPATSDAWVRAGRLLADAEPHAGGEALFQFVNRRTDVLAGFTPAALAQVRARLGWTRPVLPPGSERPLVGASVVYVLYQRPYGGIARTEAAVQVASAYSAWQAGAVAGALGLLPAHDPDATAKAIAAWPEAWRRAGEWALGRLASGEFRTMPPDWPPDLQAAWRSLQPAVAGWARGEKVDLAAAAGTAWATSRQDSSR